MAQMSTAKPEATGAIVDQAAKRPAEKGNSGDSTVNPQAPFSRIPELFQGRAGIQSHGFPIRGDKKLSMPDVTSAPGITASQALATQWNQTTESLATGLTTLKGKQYLAVKDRDGKEISLTRFFKPEHFVAILGPEGCWIPDSRVHSKNQGEWNAASLSQLPEALQTVVRELAEILKNDPSQQLPPRVVGLVNPQNENKALTYCIFPNHKDQSVFICYAHDLLSSKPQEERRYALPVQVLEAYFAAARKESPTGNLAVGVSVPLDPDPLLRGPKATVEADGTVQVRIPLGASAAQRVGKSEDRQQNGSSTTPIEETRIFIPKQAIIKTLDTQERQYSWTLSKWASVDEYSLPVVESKNKP